MCTCFAVYRERPIYAMNFDFAPIEMKVCLKKSVSGKFICFYIRYFKKYSPLVGMTDTGEFVNLQEMHFIDKKKKDLPQQSKPRVNGMQLFHDYLHGKIQLTEIMTLDEATNFFMPPSFQVHNMYANSEGQASVLECVAGKLQQQKIMGNTLVMTNFPHTIYKNIQDMDARCQGADRYAIVQKLLNKVNSGDLVEEAFQILKAARQDNPQHPTQCSMVFDPKNQAVYFKIRSDWNRIWSISFIDEVLVEINSSLVVERLIDESGCFFSEL
jgi:hypothetical protein